MGGLRQTPKISVEFDFDAEEYVLMATSYSRTQPVGARLFRADPPSIDFRHADRATADQHAGILQAYLDNYEAGGHKDKGDENMANVTRARGWWED